jgi:hypothetical protein
VNRHIFVRTCAILMVMSLFAACAGPQKRAMDPQLRKDMKSVVIIQQPEPEKYMVWGGASVPGGFMLYAFGALGGLVLGSIEVTRAESQATQLTAALRPHDPLVASSLAARMKEDLEARGVKVRVVPAPPIAEDKKGYNYAGLNFEEELIVEPVMTVVGYRADSKKIRPMITTRVRVLDARTRDEKMLELLVFGDKFGDQFLPLDPGTDWDFDDLDALYAGGERAAKGLTAGVAALSRKIVTMVRE